MTAIQDQLNKLKNNPSEGKAGELLPKDSTEGTPEVKFQGYKSARKATRIITPVGGRINFVNFEFFTQDEAIIEYLDSQIKIHGLPGITKGELLTGAERNPMETMRRTMKEEIKQELIQEAKDAALGIARDMGVTAGASALNPAGTNTVAG